MRAINRGRPRPVIVAMVLALWTCLTSTASAQVVEYYHLDAVGSVRAITNQAGVVIERHDYLPFGEEWSPSSSNTPKMFTGHERDGETGLDYFGARYYASQTGRFTSVDPVMNTDAALVDPQRWARYGYARNNPLRYTDPNGEDIFDIVKGAVNAFGSNLALGAGRLTPSNSDFALGQAVGDLAAMAAGMFETVAGGAAAGGGAVLTGSGVGSPVGLPATAAGAAAIVHGTSVAASGLVHFSQNTSGGGGRSGNKLEPDPGATGAHSTFKRGPDGKTTNTATYEPNSRNPSGFQESKRVDVTGRPHRNPDGTVVQTPHVHESGRRGVRPANPDELP